MSTSRSTGTDSDDPAAPPEGAVARQAVFATTHWSVVLAAGRGENPQALTSLETLCQTFSL